MLVSFALGEPAATPFSPAVTIDVTAHAFSSHDLTLRYRLVGFRLYSGSGQGQEIDLPDYIAQENTVLLPADQERLIGSMAFFADFFLDAGVAEGTYLVTALVEFGGEADPMEIHLGLRRIAVNNGLRLGVPATRRAVIWGRVTTLSGVGVSAAFVGYDVSWQDCNRAPVWQGGTASGDDGSYRIEVTLEDEVPEACVTLRVNPPAAFLTYPVQRRTAQLNFDKPPVNGVIADSVRVDILLRP